MNYVKKNQVIVEQHKIESYEEYVDRMLHDVGAPANTNFLAGYIGSITPNLEWFASMVKKDAVWDLKVENRWREAFGKDTWQGTRFSFVFKGNIIDPEALGNITFGYWGAALGATDEMLFLGGAVAGNGIKVWKYLKEYYGETKEDHDWIQYGISLFNSVK